MEKVRKSKGKKEKGKMSGFRNMMDWGNRPSFIPLSSATKVKMLNEIKLFKNIKYIERS